MNETVTRRRTLRVLGGAATVGVAGCTGGDGGTGGGMGRSFSHLPDALVGELSDPARYLPESRSKRAFATVRIDTEAGELVVDGRISTSVAAIAGRLLAEDISLGDHWDDEREPGEGRIGVGLEGSVDYTLRFAPETFEGFALRAAPSIDVRIDGEQVATRARTVRYHVDEGRFVLPSPARSVATANDATTALQQDIPDPEEFRLGYRPDYEWATTEILLDVDGGGFLVKGPAHGSITGIQGYLLADDLRPSDVWNGVANPHTHQIGTLSSSSLQTIDFEPGTFEGLALRAKAGVRLETVDDVIVEDASLVRYHPEDGILEQQ